MIFSKLFVKIVNFKDIAFVIYYELNCKSATHFKIYFKYFIWGESDPIIRFRENKSRNMFSHIIYIKLYFLAL